MPRSVLCTVLIIFLAESKGASPILGFSFLRSILLLPSLFDQATRAASVGSPVTLPSASISASQQSAIEVARRISSSAKQSTTVILFWVSVPVLSEQIICAHPSVSTAVSFLIIAFLLDILVTPIERTTVTTAARPSGIAATARETAIMKESSITLGSNPSPRDLKICTPNTITEIPSTSQVSIFES